MSAFLGHLLLSSAGLCAAAILVFFGRRLARREPIAWYRFLVLALLVTLALPALQLLVQGKATRWAPEGLADRIVPAFVRETEDAVANALETTEVSTEPLEDEIAAFPALFAPSRASAELKSWLTTIPWVETVLVLWFAGVLAFGKRLLARVIATFGVVRRASPALDAGLLDTWKSVTQRAPWAARVRLLVSSEVAVPSCTGLGRPTVLVPAIAQPEGSALECALLHEVVHLERGDAWIALLQSCLTVAFWFHPAAWWLSRELDLGREMACDEEVVRRQGHRRRYAQALIEHAAARFNAAVLPACPSLIAWSRSAGHLKRRIEMLVHNRHGARRGIRGAALAGTLLAVATLWSGQIAIAAVFFPGGRLQGSIVEASETQKEDRLGIRVGDVTEALAAQIGKNADAVLLVAGVEDGSIAGKCGVKTWDVITAIDGSAAATLDLLHAARDRVNAGKSVKLTVVRKGQSKKLTLKSGGAAAPDGKEMKRDADPERKNNIEKARAEMEQNAAKARTEIERNAEKARAEIEKSLHASQAEMESKLADLRALEKTSEADPTKRTLQVDVERAIRDYQNAHAKKLADAEKSLQRAMHESQKHQSKVQQETQRAYEKAMIEAQQLRDAGTHDAQKVLEKALQESQRERAEVLDATRKHHEALEKRLQEHRAHADQDAKRTFEAHKRDLESHVRKEIEEARKKAADVAREALKTYQSKPKPKATLAPKTDPFSELPESRETEEATKKRIAELKREVDRTRRQLEEIQRRDENDARKDKEEQVDEVAPPVPVAPPLPPAGIRESLIPQTLAPAGLSPSGLILYRGTIPQLAPAQLPLYRGTIPQLAPAQLPPRMLPPPPVPAPAPITDPLFIPTGK